MKSSSTTNLVYIEKVNTNEVELLINLIIS